MTNGTEQPRRERRTANRDAGAPTEGGGDQQKPAGESQAKSENRQSENREQNRESENRQQNRDQNRESNDQGGDGQGGGQQNRGDDDERGQGRRGRRFRDRRRRGERTGGEGGGGNEAELREDDVVQPVAGILDVLDNYAFVRTSGYLAGPNDVYVSMNMVRKNGLRRGDAVTGAVRVAKDGDQSNQRQKFNPLVRLDSVNGGPVEAAKNRPEFGKLTPLYPNQRLRLETTSREADDPRHRPDHADRQGPARPDRVPAEGRQDHDHAGHRQRDHQEQPRVPPDGRARRRAARRGHRHAALGQG